MLDNLVLARKNRDWKKKLNSCYYNYQGSKFSCQDSRLPDNLPNIVFDRRLYFKTEKVKASEYAKNIALKPIYSVPK